MENYSIIIFLLAMVVLLSAMQDRLKIPGPVLLILGGVAVGFIPAMPGLSIDPDIVMLIFLPPLLYDAAFNISFNDFKTNLNTIGTLAFGLVFITTGGIAVIARYLIPGMDWPLAFVLGAILSATDAVAAIGVTKGLGLSHKTTTILEGESLVNDASALIAYRFAVAAVTGVAFVWWRAGLQFLLVLGGGIIAGMVAGRLLAFLLIFCRRNKLAVIGLTLLMPFVAYQGAEEFHVSGVIAAVTLGIQMAWLSREKFPDDIRQQSRHYWEVNIFLLNGLIFVLIGLQLPLVLKSIAPEQVWPNVGYAFLITVAALAIRLLRVFGQKINLQKAFVKDNRRVPEASLLDFNNSIIIGWSGMRGIVSLAIAIGLPETLEDGRPFPMRATIIFIAVVVVLFTIVGQGLTLPMIVKRFGGNHNR